MQIIHESTPKARKDYTCDACIFLQDNLTDTMYHLTFSEKREVVKARRAGWKILKGETYMRQFNRDGGDTWTFRGRPAIHAICLEYELYPEL